MSPAKLLRCGTIVAFLTTYMKESMIVHHCWGVVMDVYCPVIQALCHDLCSNSEPVENRNKSSVVIY